MNPSAKVKAIAYVLAAFAAGGLAGGLIAGAVARQALAGPPRPHDLALRMRSHLQAALVLTPEQLRKIDPIIDKTSAEMSAIHTETMQRIDQLILDSHLQIEAVLTPEQKKRLEEMERERHEGPHDGPHDGPRDGPHDPAHWGPPHRHRPPEPPGRDGHPGGGDASAGWTPAGPPPVGQPPGGQAPAGQPPGGPPPESHSPESPPAGN